MASRVTPWERFKADANPLAKVRELKEALPDGPGLPSLYREAQERGSVLGVPVLTIGRNIFLPRQKVVERIEGASDPVR